MLKFTGEFFKHPFSIGAVIASSRYLAQGMVKDIDFTQCENIVEYGPGTGAFTKEIIERKKESAKFMIIEQNSVFYKLLTERYGHFPNVYIINGRAEDLKKYMKQYEMNHIDVIFSGLPFTLLPKAITEIILAETKTCLKTSGKFITFQYSLAMQKTFREHFRIIVHRRVVLNFPPAYILVMMKDSL